MNAKEFGEYIKGIRKSRKLTIRQLELYSGVSNAYISQIERGERKIPSPNILRKLAKSLNVEYNELMTNAGHLENPTSYGLEKLEPSNLMSVPVLGTVKAGEPISVNESIEGYEYVDPSIVRGRESFILRVKGDSMTGDRIHEGDRVVVIVQEEVESSDIAVVAIDREEGCLKRVKCQDGHCVLSSSNSSYEPMFYSIEKIHIIGKVIEVRHSVG